MSESCGIAKATPIAVFTFNRPNHAERMFGSLSQCTRLDECRVHVFCDGDPKEDSAVGASRQVVRKWAPRLDAHVEEQSTRLGLSRSIVGGVSDLCRRYGRVIVVEDDLVLHKAFIDYLLQALDRYETTSAVFQVSAYMFPVRFSIPFDALFLPTITTWGWATWERAWKIFDWDAPGALKQLSQDSVRRRFDLDGNYPYSAMLLDRLSGRNDSWGILWWWAVFRADGLALHPVRSLAWNGGLDNSGIHCSTPAYHQQSPGEAARPSAGNPIRFPTDVDVDERSYAQYRRFLRNSRLSNSLKARMWRALGRWKDRLLRRGVNDMTR